MYAVIQAGGRQYKVVEGDTIAVDFFEAPEGANVTFDQVLMTGGETTTIGTPTVEGASVEATVVGHGKADKIIVFKMKRRKNYRRRNGHRQQYTDLKIDGILAPN